MQRAFRQWVLIGWQLATIATFCCLASGQSTEAPKGLPKWITRDGEVFHGSFEYGTLDPPHIYNRQCEYTFRDEKGAWVHYKAYQLSPESLEAIRLLEASREHSTRQSVSVFQPALGNAFRDMSWGDQPKKDFVLIRRLNNGSGEYGREREALSLGGIPLEKVNYHFAPDGRLYAVLMRYPKGHEVAMRQFLQSQAIKPGLSGPNSYRTRTSEVIHMEGLNIVTFSERLTEEEERELKVRPFGR